MSAAFHTAKIWLSAMRPKTLGASLAPCFIGTAMAWRDAMPILGIGVDEQPAFPWNFAVAALVGAMLLQILSNFANDYFDAARGADGSTRLGPTRAVASGLIAPAAMKVAMLVTLLLAVVPIAYLTRMQGVEFAWIGACGAVLAVLYTGGRYPLAYVGLGDVFVFLCFGPLATAGIYAAILGEWRLAPCIIGIAPGALSVALLATNNLRDIDQDRAVGKRTLAVRLGAKFTRLEIVACWAIATALPFATWLLADAPGGALAGSTISLVSIPAVVMVARGDRGVALNGVLAGFGVQLYLLGIALAFGWALT